MHKAEKNVFYQAFVLETQEWWIAVYKDSETWKAESTEHSS